MRVVPPGCRGRGGSFLEIVLEGHGHGPVVECPDRVAMLLREQIAAP